MMAGIMRMRPKCLCMRYYCAQEGQAGGAARHGGAHCLGGSGFSSRGWARAERYLWLICTINRHFADPHGVMVLWFRDPAANFECMQPTGGTNSWQAWICSLAGSDSGSVGPSKSFPRDQELIPRAAVPKCQSPPIALASSCRIIMHARTAIFCCIDFAHWP